jgi:hypothetical protein
VTEARQLAKTFEQSSAAANIATGESSAAKARALKGKKG